MGNAMSAAMISAAVNRQLLVCSPSVYLDKNNARSYFTRSEEIMQEIYIERCQLVDLARWLGEPVQTSRVSEGITRLDYLRMGFVIVTHRMGGRDMLSVAFPEGGWIDNASCARDAFKYLKKTVYCDIGDGDVNPAKFLVLDDSGENVRNVDI